MKPSLPLLRYPSEPEPDPEPLPVSEPPPLDYRLLLSGLAYGAGASCLFVLTQLSYASLVTGLDLHGQGLFLIPRFLEQVLGRGLWDYPWIVFHAAVLGLQLWSLLQLRRVVRGQPPAANANRATFFWLALICLLGTAGLLRLLDADGVAILAALCAAVSGYAAIICQALVYRSIARHTEHAEVAQLSLGVFLGLILVLVIGFFSFGGAVFSVIANILRYIGSNGRANPQILPSAEFMHTILVIGVLATVLLQFLMTVVFYLKMRADKPPALPMATEVLPNPFE